MSLAEDPVSKKLLSRNKMAVVRLRMDGGGWIQEPLRRKKNHSRTIEEPEWKTEGLKEY